MLTKRQFDRFVWKYGTPSAILVGALFIAVSIYLSFGPPNLSSVSSPLPPPKADGGGKVGGDKVEVSADDDPYVGKESAPVTMIEFGDFQCPFCRKFWRDTLPEIKKKYIDTGKLKFVYRDFPLPIHPAAQKSGEAAECARKQGKFWEMHDKIFEEQDKQGQGTIAFETADLKKWARELGLNIQQFNSCLDNNDFEQEVKEDLADGQAAAVSGTPTFFLNGKRVVGALPYQQFEQAIEEELKRK